MLTPAAVVAISAYVPLDPVARSSEVPLMTSVVFSTQVAVSCQALASACQPNALISRMEETTGNNLLDGSCRYGRLRRSSGAASRLATLQNKAAPRGDVPPLPRRYRLKGLTARALG